MTSTNRQTLTTSSVWSSALLIAGASLGAGLLALPIQTGLAGLIPALSGLVFIWALMLITGCILVDAFIDLNRTEAGLFTLYRQELGKWSSWLVIPSFLLIFYGILVAYLSGSGSVLADLLHLPRLEKLFMLLFFLCSSIVVLVGMRVINRANTGFMVVLVASFTGLVIVAGKYMDGPNLLYRDWKFLPSALPIIVTAFAYQNVIPSICTSLNNDRVRVKKAIFFGTLLTLLISVSWIIVVLGVLPAKDGPNSLLTAFHSNLPATVPLDGKIHSKTIGLLGMLFSMAALFTSYVAVGEGLRNFLADLLAKVQVGPPNAGKLTALLTFVPPLAVTIIYPQIFLTVLDIVGGLGVVVLFGLLPAMILFRRAGQKKKLLPRALAVLLCLLCSALVALECSQELGLLRVNPQTEYHHGK